MAKRQRERWRVAARLCLSPALRSLVWTPAATPKQKPADRGGARRKESVGGRWDGAGVRRGSEGNWAWTAFHTQRMARLIGHKLLLLLMVLLASLS